MGPFDPGRIVATPGALDALERSSQSAEEFLTKHVRGERGDLDAHDAEANRIVVREGGRILSSSTVTPWSSPPGTRSRSSSS